MSDHKEQGMFMRAFSWSMEGDNGELLSGCKVTLATPPTGEEFNQTKGYVLTDYSCPADLYPLVTDSMSGKQVILYGDLVKSGKHFKFKPHSIELLK